MKEATRSRRSSPLSHSGSVNQHLGRQTGERFMASERCQVTGSSAQRRSHSRERSEELLGAGGIKSRIPLPVRILPDKDDLSSSGGDSHYMARPEPTPGHVSLEPAWDSLAGSWTGLSPACVERPGQAPTHLRH